MFRSCLRYYFKNTKIGLKVEGWKSRSESISRHEKCLYLQLVLEHRITARIFVNLRFLGVIISWVTANDSWTIVGYTCMKISVRFVYHKYKKLRESMMSIHGFTFAEKKMLYYMGNLQF